MNNMGSLDSQDVAIHDLATQARNLKAEVARLNALWGCEHETVMRLGKERDEARAEVARLTVGHEHCDDAVRDAWEVAEQLAVALVRVRDLTPGFDPFQDRRAAIIQVALAAAVKQGIRL